MCTRGAEGDTPQLTPWEACRKRDTQDNPKDAFQDPKPQTPGRDPVGELGGYELLQVVLNALEAS